jgi:hypothetical protein
MIEWANKDWKYVEEFEGNQKHYEVSRRCEKEQNGTSRKKDVK